MHWVPRVPSVHLVRVRPVRSVLPLVLAFALLGLADVVRADTRLRVELTDTGNCSVTTSGPNGRSHVRYPHQMADWRCAVTTVRDTGPVDLEVVAPPGAERPASSFPQLAWSQENGRWVGRARLPSLPSFVRLVPAALLADAGPVVRPFVRTALLRERNNVRAMLRQARREVEF